MRVNICSYYDSISESIMFRRPLSDKATPKYICGIKSSIESVFKNSIRWYIPHIVTDSTKFNLPIDTRAKEFSGISHESGV